MALEGLDELINPQNYQGTTASEPTGGALPAVTRDPNKGAYDFPPLPQFASGNNGLMTVFGILAAARGNFGPLIQLQEQQRKTEVAKQVTPFMINFRDLVNKGKVDEAMSYLQQGAAQFGSRVPELAGYFQPEIAKLNKFQEGLADIGFRIKVLEAGKKVDPEHFPKSEQAKLELLKALKDNPTPVNADVIKDSLERMFGVQSRIEENRVTTMYPATGEVTTRPLPEQFRTAQFEGMAGLQLSKDFGLSAPELANIANGEPVIRGGKDITPDMQDIVKARYGQTLAMQRDFELMKSQSFTPENNEARYQMLQAAGVSDPQLALATGNYPREILTSARESVQNYRFNLAYTAATAGEKVKMEQNKFAFQEHDMSVINADPKSPNFGQTSLPMTLREMEKNPQLRPTRNPVLDKKIIPSLQALSGFDYINIMFDQLGNPSDPASRLSVGLVQELSRFLGVEVLPGQAGVEVARQVVEKQINRLEEMEAVDSRTVASVKAMLTGSFADATSARVAVELAKQRLKESIAVYLGNHSFKPSELPENMKKQLSEPVGEVIQKNLPTVEKGDSRTESGITIHFNKGK